MGFNFPASPTTGDTYAPGAGLPTYRWDGEKWRTLVAVAATASAFISDTVPGAPVDGMLWWESDSGNLYIRYNDGDSTQWVLVGNFPSLAGFVRHDAAQALSDAQKLQARQNTGVQSATRYITAADSIGVSDHGKLIVFNSASNISVAIAALATLPDGWWCDIYNFSTGIVTLDPSASEAIDGITTATIYSQERMRIYSTGSGFITFNHSGEWVSYTPSWSGTGGGTPGVTTTGRYKKVRSSVEFMTDVLLNTVAGCTGFLAGTVPIAAIGIGPSVFTTETNVNGFAFHGQLAGTGFTVRKYDNTFPWTAGARHWSSGVYECAK